MTRHFLLFLVPLLLTGCALAVAPRAPQPETLPATFSQQGEAPLPARWWEAFNDPQLSALITEALQENPSLQATRQRLRAAVAVARQSDADSALSLDASANGSVTRQQQSSRQSDSQSLTLGLAASYEVDLWGGIEATQRAAHLDAEASAENLRTAAITLSAEVATAWYELISQRKRQQQLEHEIALEEESLTLLRQQVRRGFTPLATLRAQQLQLESLKSGLAERRALLTSSARQLAILLGRSDIAALPTGDLPSLPPLPQTGLPAKSLKERPDLRAAWLQVLAADARVTASTSERFPRLSLGTTLQSGSDSVSALVDDWLARLVANLTLPLLDGGARRAAVEASAASRDAALHDYAAALLAAFAEIEEALQRERHGGESLLHLERQLPLARQSLEQAQSTYRHGAGTYSDLLDARLTVVRLEEEILLARQERLNQRITLCRALGGGWPLSDEIPSDPKGIEK